MSFSVRCINDTEKCILEGELRCEKLAQYLLKHDAGKDIWICEDGSSIIRKIIYDPTLDQLIGITLPIDDTGCPKRYESTARDEEEIRQFCKMTKSSHIYLILAIPLKEGVAPFILQMYGTDNRFTARNVIKRWNYTTNELKRLFVVLLNI